MEQKLFRNRVDAGQKLARVLSEYVDANDSIVIGLPRGGVVVAAEIARILRLPLDIIVPRKVGAEWNPEYAIGAITESGEVVWSEAGFSMAGEAYKKDVVKRERAEANRRLALYRGTRPPRDITDKTVVLVDDGVATGFTMLAAIKTARAERAKNVIVAVPHGAASSVAMLKEQADKVVSLLEPEPYVAVGQWYESFVQTTDEEVVTLLKEFE